MNRLTLLFATVAALFLPIHALAQMPTPIDTVQQLAGDWEGWIGHDQAGITIKGDGTYEGFGRGGQWVVGHIVVKDGTALYKSNLSEGSVFLFTQGGANRLRFITNRGGIAELKRTK